MRTQVIRQSVGIDIAMNDFKACYGRVNTKMEKEIISESTFENSYSGIDQLLVWLSKYLINREELYFLMESTGVYHESCPIICTTKA